MKAALSLILAVVFSACAGDSGNTDPNPGAGGTNGGAGASAGQTGGGATAGKGGSPESGGAGKGGSSGSTGGAGTSGSSGSGGSGSGGSAGGSAGASGCSESALKNPLTINGNKRFFYGVNYAWQDFATDFGGKASWSKKGVASNKDACTKSLKEMKDNGVDVVRWWMFPDLRGDGVVLDGNKTPTGLGGTVVDDINAALQIAKDLDMHIELTLFSFDNFRPDDKDSVGLGAIVLDDTKRAALMDKVVRPIAKAVAASPNTDRMVSWDVINEPEWALNDEDGYGDQKFDCNTKLSCIKFAQMETFVKDVVKALKAESKAPVSVGSAAVKWAKAWSKCDLDYYDFHWYGWVDQWFPHTKTPTDWGIADKPVVVGEFPLVPTADTSNSAGKPFGGVGYEQLVTDWLNAGYAGAQGWAFSDTSGAGFSWANGKTAVKAWADAHACLIHY
jgi:hypothetical protein